MKKRKQTEKKLGTESNPQGKVDNPYNFSKKDKQAIEFLKKHPIPKDLLK